MKKIHLIAICGTGMGSLAGLLKEKGYEVTGSDANVYPPMSDQLAALGIPVRIGFHPRNIEETGPDLVIVGNAVSKDNPEVGAVLERKLPMMSMPEAVEKIFLADRISLVVAGTHGKTTTCGLLAWILDRCGKSPGFLVGGILKNFDRSCQFGGGDYFVIEGDEYDSAFFDKGPKFLHYRPRYLILNAVEFDHADIYRDLDHLMEAFSRLLSLIPPEGLILADGDNPNVRRLLAKPPCRVLTFGFLPEADLRAEGVSLDEKTRFRLLKQGKEVGPVISPMIGRHNIKNLLGVIGLLLEIGIPLREINSALSEFQGVKRRQEVIATIRGITIIDDFAHHPTAIFETLSALRSRYVQGKLWAIFEPRSNTTRRNVFQKDFVGAFDPADEVILAPPWLPEKIPAGERLDPARLIRELVEHGKKARYFSTADPVGEIVATVAREAVPGDVLCIMSNGGFGGIHEKMVSKLK